MRPPRVALLAAVAAIWLGCVTPRAAPRETAASARRELEAVFGKHLEFAILEDYDKGDSLARVERDFALFHELGITTWRGSFGWDDYEPSPGNYDLVWLRSFAQLAARRSIVLRPYLGYTAPWAGTGRSADGHSWNDPPRDPAAFGRFAATVARALRPYGSVASYEIYNEENMRLWWDGSASEYAGVLAAGADSIRAADPRAGIVLGGLVWPDASFLDTVCAYPGNPARFDVVALHAYPETWTPESVTVERYLDAGYHGLFLETVDRGCGGKRVWMNETGFATAHGRSERQQADWWARAIATFAADRRIESIGVYEIRDLAPGSDVIGEPENFHLGLLRTDGTPKLAFRTVRLLVRLLAGPLEVADAELRVTPGASAATARLGNGVADDHGANGHGSTSSSGAQAHLFRHPDGRMLLMAWVPPGMPEATVDIRLPGTPRQALEYALDGTSRPAAEHAAGGLVSVRLEPGETRIFAFE